MRNWERCSNNPRQETVAQLFDKLLEGTKMRLVQKSAEDKDGMNLDQNEIEKEPEPLP